MTADEIRVLEALGKPVAVLSLDRAVIWANRCFSNLFGVLPTAHDQLSRGVRDDADLDAALGRAVDSLSSGNRLSEFRWTFTGPESVVFRGSSSRLDTDRIVVVLDEVTDQVETEALFRVARDYLDRVLNQIPVGLIVFDADQRTTFFNTSQASLSESLGLAHTLTDVIGARIADVYPVLDDAAWSGLIETVIGQDIPATRDRLAYPVSEPCIYLQLQLYPLTDVQGRASAVICVTEDVSRLVQLEHDLVKKERLAVAGQLVATFHHQINNPLVSILGMAEMMLYKGTLDDDLAARVERIRGGALRIAEVTKKMREIRELGRDEWPQELPSLTQQIMRPSA